MSDSTVRSSAEITSMNARRAERRRNITRTVRSLRDQLASGSGIRPQYDYELLCQFAHSRVWSSYAIPFLIAVVAAVALLWVDRLLVASWAVMATATHGAVILSAVRFLRLDRKSVSLATWRRWFVFSEALVGLSWAMLFILPTEPNVATDVFQFSTMLIIIAVSSLLGSTLPGAMAAATLPLTIVISFGFIIKAFSSGAEYISYYGALAIMPATAEAFFLALGYRLYASALSEIEARSEKDSLIAELEQAKAISDESRRKSEEANLAKSRFLATMSHELRTPLNAILGFSEVMQNEILGPMTNATYKGYVNDIHSSGSHLLNLINEILDLSRIEAGRYTLNEEAVSLSFVVEESAHMMTLRARNKGVTIVEHYEDNMPKVWGDERALRQITLNILSNAVKFTPSGGTITVKVGWTAGGGQYVAIRDTGPGIPEEEIPIVLSAFGQGAIAIKSAEQGTGLGLNIVQALVVMHGGTFDFKSKLREGTEVTFTLPKARVMEIMPAINDRPHRRAPAGMPVASLAMLESMRAQLRR